MDNAFEDPLVLGVLIFYLVAFLIMVISFFWIRAHFARRARHDTDRVMRSIRDLEEKSAHLKAQQQNS